MNKPFNIHDWQAKQRLAEADRFGFASGDNYIPDDVDSQGRNTWGDKVGYADDQIKAKLVQYIDHTFASWMSPSNPEMSKEYAKGTPYFDKLIRGIMGILPARMSEHHDDKDFPGKDLSAWDLLDKIQKADKDLYNNVEKFMKSMTEMSTTGTGASFNAGSGEGYMTPKAFKKKKDK
jgi:hypothetical protein